MNSATLTRTIGFTLLFPAAVGLLPGGVPTVLGPLPRIRLSWPRSMAALIVPVLFFLAWEAGLFRGGAKIHQRSHVLLALASVLSVVWFVSGWEYGLKYQGVRYTYLVYFVMLRGLAPCG